MQERRQNTSLQNSEYMLAFNIIKSILHLSLKSMYEILRQQEIRTIQYQNQLIADLYYFYLSSIYLPFVLFSTARIVTPSSHDDNPDDQSGLTEQRKLAGNSIADFTFDDNMQYKEDLHNLSGIINEVVTTIQARTTASNGKAKKGIMGTAVSLDESLLIIICDVNVQKLFK